MKHIESKMLRTKPPTLMFPSQSLKVPITFVFQASDHILNT